MSTHQSTTRHGRRTIGLVCGSLAILAIAGTTATQAFAAAGHTSQRTAHHAAITLGTHQGHKVGPAAKVLTNTTTSLAEAIDAVAADTGKVGGEQPNLLEPGSDPRALRVSQAQFVPTGGSTFASVQVFYSRPGLGGLGAEGGVWNWKHTGTATLADGSVVRTAEGDNGSIVAAERTVDGIVETAYAYASVKDGPAALTADQLTQVVAQLTPPTS
jgi:hypothetical protein